MASATCLQNNAEHERGVSHEREQNSHFAPYCGQMPNKDAPVISSLAGPAFLLHRNTMMPRINVLVVVVLAIVWSSHLRELGRLLNPVGSQVHSDDILNDLFANFCIGK